MIEFSKILTVDFKRIGSSCSDIHFSYQQVSSLWKLLLPMLIADLSQLYGRLVFLADMLKFGR